MIAAASTWVAGVYGDLQPEIRAFALRRTREAGAADDITQEAFMRLFCAARDRRQPDDPRAWLYRVVQNLTISAGRKRSFAEQRRPTFASNQAPEDSPETTAIRRERRDAVDEALATLADDARMAVTLAARGFTCEEIGIAIGRTELATRALLCRTRARLRTRLEAIDFRGSLL